MVSRAIYRREEKNAPEGFTLMSSVAYPMKAAASCTKQKGEKKIHHNQQSLTLLILILHELITRRVFCCFLFKRGGRERECTGSRVMCKLMSGGSCSFG